MTRSRYVSPRTTPGVPQTDTRERRHTTSSASRYALGSLSARRRSRPPGDSPATSATPHRPLQITGSPGSTHGYWPLRAAIAPAQAHAANRRLAAALHACQSAVTSPTAILRPPGTRNFKHNPPTAVRVLRLTDQRRTVGEVLANVPSGSPVRPARGERKPSRYRDDPLWQVTPARYVEALLGQTPDADHKIHCPFHPDARPSLHVYSTAQAGWHCFQCGRGGTVIDLAAALWGYSTRGAPFRKLHRELCARLLSD